MRCSHSFQNQFDASFQRNQLFKLSRQGRIHLDLYMWTLDKPTSSCPQPSDLNIAWVAILLNLVLLKNIDGR